MTQMHETPPGQTAGLGNLSSGKNDSFEISPNPHVAHAKIALLHDDIYHNVSALQVQLDCAIAMGFAAEMSATPTRGDGPMSARELLLRIMIGGAS